MSTMDKYFSEQIDRYVEQMPDHTLIFFKGFSIGQVRQLIVHKNSVLNDPDLLDGEFINLEYLNECWLDIAAKIKRAKKPLVGFYEELVAIREVIPRIKLDHLVVIENNLLSPWVPCNYLYSKAVALFDHLEGEREAPADSELSQLLQQYGDVKLLDDDKALLLPATVDDERLVFMQFWKGLIEEQEFPEHDGRYYADKVWNQTRPSIHDSKELFVLCVRLPKFIEEPLPQHSEETCKSLITCTLIELLQIAKRQTGFQLNREQIRALFEKLKLY